MSTETLYCLGSPRNISAPPSVSDNLCKIIVEIGGGMFAGVCRTEKLVLWRSAASGTLLYCSIIDQLSADVVRSTIHDSDSQFAVSPVQL
jgi:hypothetical protein